MESMNDIVWRVKEAILKNNLQFFAGNGAGTAVGAAQNGRESQKVA